MKTVFVRLIPTNIRYTNKLKNRPSRVLLEKLTVPQLFRIFSSFYGIK